jgi:phosphoglycerate dehydrogenase-like enzyme
MPLSSAPYTDVADKNEALTYFLSLKLIHLFPAGIDHFAKHPIILGSDIDITTSSGIHGHPIAEWVLMTTLSFSEHYSSTYDLQKQHFWGQNEHHFSHGSDWVGKRVGIASYGSIGRQGEPVLRPPISLTFIPKPSFRWKVVRLFSALGCTVLA